MSPMQVFSLTGVLVVIFAALVAFIAFNAAEEEASLPGNDAAILAQAALDPVDSVYS